MAVFADLAGYLRTNFTVADDHGTMLKLIFRLPGDRSQVVFVHRGTMSSSKQEWAIIESPCARAAAVDLLEVGREVAEYTVGGLAVQGDLLVIKHAVPLGSLDIDEFGEPFEMVLQAADLVERQFAGGDEF